MVNLAASAAIIVPGTTIVLLIERPSLHHPDGDTVHIAGYYDLATNKFVYIETIDFLFCSGVSYTVDGDVVIVGGFHADGDLATGLWAIRVFNRNTRTIQTVAQLNHRRWYPTVTLTPNGRLLTMGGTLGKGSNFFMPWYMYELWDPQEGTGLTTDVPMITQYVQDSQQVLYPFNFVLPTGDLLTFSSRYGRIINIDTGAELAVLPQLTGAYDTQYPYTATSVMLALLPEKNYAVDIVIFGGQVNGGAYTVAGSDTQSSGVNVTAMTQASPFSQQLSVGYDAASGTYSVSPRWDIQYMGMPRVMGDITLLPNGKGVLLNGAKYGIAGDALPFESFRGNADFPALDAYLFDPDQPSGRHYSLLARTTIARMYHSTATLTIDGAVLVTGCDRCWKFNSTLAYSQSTDASGNPINPEYRVEIFYPPYFYFTEVKPKILSAPQGIPYGPATFTVTYAGELSTAATVTRATLVAPSSVTHSFNTNQRVVGLVVASNDVANQVLTLVGPPNQNIAVPGMYMLFLLNGDVYSKGVWVSVR